MMQAASSQWLNVINVVADAPLGLIEGVSKTIDLIQPLLLFLRKCRRLGNDACFSPLEAGATLVSIGLINSFGLRAAQLLA